MKITKIGIYPNNSEGNKVVEQGKMEGDFNLLNVCFEKHCKSLERSKISYIFKIEDAPANYYAYSLTDTEFKEAKQFINNFGKTW